MKNMVALLGGRTVLDRDTVVDEMDGDTTMALLDGRAGLEGYSGNAGQDES